MIRAFEQWQPRLHDDVYVDPLAAVIGRVTLHAQVSVWPGAVLRGDVQAIEVGRASNIQDGSVLHVTHDSEWTPGGRGLVVGAEVTVGHNVTLHACTVGDRCLIGMGSVVLDGAELAAEVMLGAGSLVPPGRRLEGGYLWLGSPVRRQRPLSDAERAWLRYSAAHYVRLAARHRRALEGGA